MSAPALVLPELPAPSPTKSWMPAPRSMFRHLARRVDPCEMICIGMIFDVTTAAASDEIFRSSHVRRVADPQGNPTTAEELYKSRAYISSEVFQQASNNKARQIETCLAHAVHEGFIGREIDQHGFAFYWPRPENFRAGAPKPPRTRKRSVRRASVLDHSQPVAAFTQPQPIAQRNGQPDAQPVAESTETADAQPVAERSQMRQTFTTGREGEQTQPNAPHPVAGQPTAAGPSQPDTEFSQLQAGLRQPSAISPLYPLVSESGDQREELLASQPQPAAQPNAGNGEAEAAQMNAALPELVKALGPMTPQTALNILAASRAALVLLVIAFLARKHRKHWQNWGVAVTAVRGELHHDVGTLFGFAPPAEASPPPSIEERIDADLDVLEMIAPTHIEFEDTQKKLLNYDPNLVEKVRHRRRQQRE